MGYYFNPPDELKQRGRLLYDHPNFHDMTKQLKADELLIGLYDRALYRAAPHLFSAGEFAAHEQVYNTGQAIHRSFYALSRRQFEDSGEKALEQQR